MQATGTRSVKVALIHAAVRSKDKTDNLQRLLQLNYTAAAEGAKIIVNPELATSGYSFSNRMEIAPFAESIPGPSTEKFAMISKKFGVYICIGLPEVDLKTGIYYNSAAVIGPDGSVIGKHRKIAPAYKENLWAAEGNLPPAVFPTDYGKLGVVICADAYSYKPVRAAVLRGARLLLIPVNWPSDYNDPEKYWRARALENGIYVLVCNRTGPDVEMDCSSGESFIIDKNGQVGKKIMSADDTILYSQVPLDGNGEFSSSAAQMQIRRRPHCYGDIALATFAHLGAEYLLGLPAARVCNLATVQFRPQFGNPALNLAKVLALIDESVALAEARSQKIDLLVFPELALSGIISDYKQAESLCEPIPGPASQALVEKAKAKDVSVVIGLAEEQEGKFYNSSVLISPGSIEGVYRKVHLGALDKLWAEAGERFPTFDLSFGRIGMLLGSDMLFPESLECLAKMGTDILCVPSAWEEPSTQFVWEARLSEQMHLAIANQWGVNDSEGTGNSAIYSYAMDPDQRRVRQAPAQADHIIMHSLNPADARRKNFIEKIDYDILLNLGGQPGGKE